MTKSAKVLIGLVALAALLGILGWKHFAPPKFLPQCGPAISRADLLVNVVLNGYRYYHGSYPYSPDGEESALYSLKPITNEVGEAVTIFDAPDADSDIGGPAQWDDVNKKLVGADYEYANIPPEERERLLPDEGPGGLVIIAEKPGLRASVRYFTTVEASGVWWTRALWPHQRDFKERLAGKVLHIAEHKDSEGKVRKYWRFVEPEDS